VRVLGRCSHPPDRSEAGLVGRWTGGVGAAALRVARSWLAAAWGSGRRRAGGGAHRYPGEDGATAAGVLAFFHAAGTSVASSAWVKTPRASFGSTSAR
jgi:hypothetical protein